MEFPSLGVMERVIIATKGLPCTGKSEIATRIGEWVRCSVFSIDDFLGTLSLEKGYSSESMPSTEEAERLHRLAFNGLCKSALRYLHYIGECVVIKSRLCSTFELDSLLQLSQELRLVLNTSTTNITIIIIECHTKNEHRLCARLEGRVAYIPEHEKEWYKARSRLDFEKARDDWLSSQPNWDRHLSNLINSIVDERHSTWVKRMFLDPFDELNLNISIISDVNPAFRDAIVYLLTRQRGPRQEDWIGEEIIGDKYEVLRFDKLRQYLVKKELQRVRKNSKYLCPTYRGGKCCVFKACTEEEQLLHQVVGRGDDDDHKYCGACGERVVSAGYTCYFCILTLHKSCTELQGFNFLDLESDVWMKLYPKYCEDYLPRTYACKSCTEGGNDFNDECDACLFETHLRCRKFPTIIKHDSHHHHSLSLQVGDQAKYSKCKACASSSYRGKYGCYLCGLYYCLTCLSRPKKVEHKHGGHKHVMKLLYSRDGMEPEEDYWCDVCYKDIDPQNWFYFCPDCPRYETHSRCIKLDNK